MIKFGQNLLWTHSSMGQSSSQAMVYSTGLQRCGPVNNNLLYITTSYT